jgi:hypothetical protein
VILSVIDSKRLCESLLSLDVQVIYSAMFSLDGEEISSAAKPSASAMMPSEQELSSHFKSVRRIIAAYSGKSGALPEGERAFGELKSIVAIFSNFKVIIVLNRGAQIAAALVTMKDADVNKISFQASRLMLR